MKNKNSEIIDLSTYIFLIICFLLCIALLNGCKSVEHVQVVHDTIQHYKVKEVPVVVHDSIYHTQYVNVYTKGDTVYKEIKVNDGMYVEIPIEIHDTIFDSKVVNVPVEVIKEKNVKGFFYWFGIIMCFISVIGLVVWIYYETSRNKHN